MRRHLASASQQRTLGRCRNPAAVQVSQCRLLQRPQDNYKMEKTARANVPASDLVLLHVDHMSCAIKASRATCSDFKAQTMWRKEFLSETP